MKLKGRTAIVTGGSRGIGKAVVHAFVQEGAKVAVFARNRKELAAVEKEMNAIIKGSTIGFRCDVARESNVRKSVAAAAKKLGRIDILVNAAGIQQPIGPFRSATIKVWEDNVAVNLFGTVRMTYAVLPFMFRRRSGAIVNFSGGGATSSRPNFSAYAVSKVGVVKFTEVLADELAGTGIRVNAIAPGAVNTFMLNEILGAGARSGKAETAAAKKRLREGGVPPELPAELVVFLASSASAPLTGRLISAPWDNWKQWNAAEIKRIQKSDRYTLRRIK